MRNVSGICAMSKRGQGIVANALLGEVLVKLDQNAPNLLRGDVGLIQLGINRHKNDVCWRLEVINQAIARTFAFLNITVPHPDLEYRIVGSGHLVAHDLTSPKLVNHRLNVRANVPVLLGQRSQVTLEFRRVLNMHRLGWLTRHQCLPTIQTQVVSHLPSLLSSLGGS